jgi:hypothetical protein
VVFHTGSTARAARMRVRSIAATCHPRRVLTLSSAFRTVPRSFVRPSYYASVPYSSDSSTQVVTALRRAAAGGPWLVFARLRRWRATFCAAAIRVSTCCLNLSFLSNQMPSQRRVVWLPSLASATGVIVWFSLTLQSREQYSLFLVRCIISSFLGAKTTLFATPHPLIALMSSPRRVTFLSKV